MPCGDTEPAGRGGDPSQDLTPRGLEEGTGPPSPRASEVCLLTLSFQTCVSSCLLAIASGSSGPLRRHVSKAQLLSPDVFPHSSCPAPAPRAARRRPSHSCLPPTSDSSPGTSRLPLRQRSASCCSPLSPAPRTAFSYLDSHESLTPVALYSLLPPQVCLQRTMPLKFTSFSAIFPT